MHSTVAHPSIYLSPNSISLWLGTLCETHRQWYMVCKKKINFSNVFSYVNSLFTHYYICSARTVFFQHCIFPLKSKLNNELLVFSFGLFLVKNLFKNSPRRIFLASWLFLISFVFPRSASAPTGVNYIDFWICMCLFNIIILFFLHGDIIKFIFVCFYSERFCFLLSLISSVWLIVCCHWWDTWISA